jgi:hypothetical protein
VLNTELQVGRLMRSKIFRMIGVDSMRMEDFPRVTYLGILVHCNKLQEHFMI